MFALWTRGRDALASCLWGTGRMPSLWIVAGLALLAAIAERQSVPLTRNTEASVAFLPIRVLGGRVRALRSARCGGACWSRRFSTAVSSVGRLSTQCELSRLRRPEWRRAPSGLRVTGQPSVRSFSQRSPLHSRISQLTCSSIWARKQFDAQDRLRALRKALAPLLFVQDLLYTPLVALLVYGYQLYSVAVVARFSCRRSHCNG